MNQDLVERGETKSVYELDIANRVKDGVRENSIEVIIQSLATSVLMKYALMDQKIVQETLNIYAQLIDWNDLKYFESLVQSCIGFLQDQTGAVSPQLKNGAFNCV